MEATAPAHCDGCEAKDGIIRTLARRVHELVMSNRRREAELVRLRSELQRLRRAPIPVRPRDT